MKREPPALLAVDAADLPDRIVEMLRDRWAGDANFVVGLRTAFKPNATIPIIWLVVLPDKLLLCNTHKTRGVWRKYEAKEIDALRVAPFRTGQLGIEIIESDPNAPALCLQLPRHANRQSVARFIALATAALSRS